MQRRTILRLGFASAAVVAAAGGAALMLQPAAPAGQVPAGGQAVFRAVGNAILDGSLPAAEPARSAALAGMLERIGALLANLPAHAQAEIGQLLALLATAPGRFALAGLGPAWADASIAEIQEALEGMRRSRVALKRQAYQALHDIVGSAYFSEPATWGQLGYPGPVAL